MEEKKRILIVDDDNINCAILTDVLEQNYLLTEVSDKAAAWAFLERNADVGLILLDIFLSDDDGMKLLSELKSDERYSKIPVLVIASAAADISCVERALKAGAEDYISRPFSKVIIEKRVSDLLAQCPKYFAEQGASHGSRTVDYLVGERRKIDFFTSLTDEIWFEYFFHTKLLRLPRKVSFKIGVAQETENPFDNEMIRSYFAGGGYERLMDIIKSFSAESTYYEGEIRLTCDGQKRWFRISLQTEWSHDENKPLSLFGMLSDIDEPYARLEKIEEAGEKTNCTDVPVSMLQNEVLSLTAAQANSLMQYFKKMFTVVRLVEPKICMQYAIDSLGKIIEKPYQCYTVWNKKDRCSNCISSIVAHTHKPKTKLEFINNELYNVSASYLLVDGAPYILELASYVDHDAMFSLNEKQEVLNTIAAHNRQLYIDPVTGVYNRRYYDNRLRDLNGEYAFAMLDLDNFKQINDSYGHLAGDAALAAAANAIKDNVRSGDDVIRYGGDEFFLLLRNMPPENMENKLRKILCAVQSVRLSDYPDLRMTVSIGGAYAKGKLSQMLRKADMAMYDAKSTRNSIAIYVDKDE